MNPQPTDSLVPFLTIDAEDKPMPIVVDPIYHRFIAALSMAIAELDPPDCLFQQLDPVLQAEWAGMESDENPFQLFSDSRLSEGLMERLEKWIAHYEETGGFLPISPPGKGPESQTLPGRLLSTPLRAQVRKAKDDLGKIRNLSA